MRTIGVVAFVLFLGFSVSMLSMSGIGPAIFGQDTDDEVGLGPQEDLEQAADDASVDEGDEGGIGADVAAEDEPTTIGFVLEGAQFAVGLVASIAALPFTLMNLGLPRFFAIPLGMVLQIVGAVGLFQFLTGREWI
ncbi:uncharacterized protein NP_7038A (plasmid) [Natronomonas pharaonis DSM 2160]|uniref:Uncharacterized protein n=1 Tax=Natronomonas pharaonis (strain ATCC 35678 / DSM 2160 / CIP 103997 / JCM 8858 / NBRC 14720 / NCIMB 2260 / Gabara) TaxID=348780 RepID=Q3ILT5_NATPD|nr:hypothetical protein [Natronomonas pharaonis]CAI49748.1 uncharacterized protein NP_3314A [Natronomonas pharaonis DSM 2160]CAI50935.1 uncharacterized protein NP_7038A [Natronomonas pharaonis DSM 2160]